MQTVPKIIWMYWEDRLFSRKPAYLRLCHETIERHRGDYELRLLSDKTVSDYLELPKKVQKFEKIAHRADYIRFMILRDYGGVWLDADVILLKDIGEAVEPYINDFDFLGYGRELGKPSINFMACMPNSDLIVAHVEQMQAYIERLNEPGFVKKVKLPWTGIGHEILWPLAENYSYFHHARERIAPVFWDEWKKFLEAPGDEELFFQNDPFMVMLYNAFMFKPLMKQSKEDVLASNTLLSRLFLRALE